MKHIGIDFDGFIGGLGSLFVEHLRAFERYDFIVVTM